MRDLVLEKISEIWDEHVAEEFQMSFDDVKALADAEVLAVYEELIGFNG